MQRVALFVPQFPKISETFIAAKFKELIGRNWDVHVVCYRSPKEDRNSFASLLGDHASKGRVHVCWPQSPKWLGSILMVVSLFRCLILNPSGTLRYLRKGRKKFGIGVVKHLYLDSEFLLARPDLIHYEFGALAVEKAHLKELLDTKLSVSFRGYDLAFSGAEDPTYYDDLWRNVDGVHVLGQCLLDKARSRGLREETRAVKIPPAIDIDFFSSEKAESDRTLGTPDRPLRILSVGRLEWIKGYEYSIQALELLVKNGIDAELHVIGDGPYMEAVAFSIHQCGLRDRVTLLGAQPRDRVKAEMQWADIFLHSSVSEGFCNAVLEAQAMGLPVVSSDADGLPENVRHDATGFIVPRRDPNAIADRLEQLAKDPDLRGRLGSAGKHRVRTDFQLKDQITAFERFFREIAGRTLETSSPSGNRNAVAEITC